MTPEQRPCDACNALPGEPCAWDCIGLAAVLDGIEAVSGASAPGRSEATSASTVNHVSPGAKCDACRRATPEYGARLIARALTVQASKLYAVLHYRAELDDAR